MITQKQVDELVRENRKRYEALLCKYNPITGEGAPLERKELRIADHPIPVQWVPVDMFGNDLVKALVRRKSIRAFIEKELKEEYTAERHDRVLRELAFVRSRYDFTFWAYSFVQIKPKEGGGMIPFRLNYAQVRYLLVLEGMRRSGIPIRIILLKARQWGGSTLTQIYYAWIQMMHKRGWYSTIVGQTKNTAGRILEMYTKFIENYPPWMLGLTDDNTLKLSQYGKGTSNDFEIRDRRNRRVNDTVIQIGSVIEPDNLRSGDVAMVHYSEVGVWKDTTGRRPEDIIRSISSGMLYRPYTAEVLESSAKGTGNFFHREWVRAEKGESNRTPVFIPWFFILNDTIPFATEEEEYAFARWLLECKDMEAPPQGYNDEGKYYYHLWELGATLQGINWYRVTRKGVDSHSDMASEAPSDPVEAFESTGRRVFDMYEVNEMRKTTCKPSFVGEVYANVDRGEDCLVNVRFAASAAGRMKIWEKPEHDLDMRNRYLVVVDIGGRWKGADWSVITVIDRLMMTMGGKPEVVAEWRGHIDHDLLAWKAAQIAAYYDNALLVYESNTLESKDKERDTDGNDIEYILNLVAGVYTNMYARNRSSEEVQQGAPLKWGFHTNTQTKPAIIHHLIACVRDAAWVEREDGACDELAFYEKKENGSFGAVSGQHDDLLMTRAIGLWICYREMDMPQEMNTAPREVKEPQSEATI